MLFQALAAVEKVVIANADYSFIAIEKQITTYNYIQCLLIASDIAQCSICQVQTKVSQLAYIWLIVIILYYLNLRMNKYFKNQNKITTEKLLKTYQNFVWGDHPEFGSNKREAYRLIDQCQQSDAYTNYKKELQLLKAQLKQIQRDLRSLQSSKNQIIMKNSQEQYDQVMKQVKEKERDLESKIRNLDYKPPLSKHQILQPIYDSMKKAEKLADDEIQQRMKDNRDRCTCNKGAYCEC